VRYFLVLSLIAIAAVITGCSGGEEQASVPTPTPTVTATVEVVGEIPTPTPTAVATETEVPSTPAPALEENTAKLAVALTLEADGVHRSYDDPEGSFQIRYFPDSRTVDFEVWILKTPVQENALKVVEFIHQARIGDHCHPRLRISWNPSEALVREGKAGPEDFLPPVVCVGQ